MDLIRKTNGWSCILEAFAMAMGTTTEELIREIGHDGSLVLDETLHDPLGRRGFHVQELIQAAIHAGKSVTPFELIPAILLPSGGTLPIRDIGRGVIFNHLVASSRGVLTGRSRSTPHAVAFDRGKVYDSAGYVYDFSFLNCEQRGFFAQCAWLVA